MPVNIIDKIKRTISGQKIGDIEDLSGQFVKTVTIHTDGTIRVTSQSATDASESVDLTPGALADGIVSAAKLADDAVGTAKIKNLAVTTAKLADASVTTAKIPDDAVTEDKLASGVGGMSVALIGQSSPPVTPNHPTRNYKKVSITGYTAVALYCQDETGGSGASITTAFIPKLRIDGWAGTDADFPASANRNRINSVIVGSDQCYATLGKAVDGSLKWSFGGNPQAYWRIYGIK